MLQACPAVASNSRLCDRERSGTLVTLSPRSNAVPTLGASAAVGVFLGPSPVAGFSLVRVADGKRVASLVTAVPNHWIVPVVKVFGEELTSLDSVRGTASLVLQSPVAHPKPPPHRLPLPRFSLSDQPVSREAVQALKQHRSCRVQTKCNSLFVTIGFVHVRVCVSTPGRCTACGVHQRRV